MLDDHNDDGDDVENNNGRNNGNALVRDMLDLIVSTHVTGRRRWREIVFAFRFSFPVNDEKNAWNQEYVPTNERLSRTVDHVCAQLTHRLHLAPEQIRRTAVSHCRRSSSMDENAMTNIEGRHCIEFV